MSRQTARLFPGHESLLEDVAADPRHPGWNFVIGRVLEEGNGADLRWLSRSKTQPELASWFEHHGLRALSRRSRQFWAVILRRPIGTPTANPLWPLG